MADFLVYLDVLTLVSPLDPLGNLCLDAFHTNKPTWPAPVPEIQDPRTSSINFKLHSYKKQFGHMDFAFLHYS